MIFSKVTDSLIAKFRGGSRLSLISKSEGNSNNYQSKNAFGPGIEINPAKNERIVIARINNSDSYMVTIAGISEGVEPDTSPGERRFFSVKENGTLSSYVKLTNDEVLELNGSTNFAVKYNELETAFNQLKTDFNNFVGKYNLHTHSALNTPTTNLATISAADITPSKNEKVRF